MATDRGDGDYLGAYRRFFEDFVAQVDPGDQLPVKMSGYDLTEAEISGEIMDWTLQYLNQKYCPPSLQAYLVRVVIEEVKQLCSKQAEACGWRCQENAYAPLRLMQAAMNKVNEICLRYLDNSRLALLPPPPSTPMPLVSTCAIKNSRRKMEDRHVIVHDLHTVFSIQDDSPASYYAVFDGHAGQEAAVYCSAHLHQYLAESVHYPTDPKRALRDAFLTTDAHFIEKSNKQNLSSGTTAVCALLLKKMLYVAWVGDSQAVLSKRGQIMQLVNPHRPDREDEKKRVEDMGGTVIHWGTWRVNGLLAVSRAIGDVVYKPYVTGDPDIESITLDGSEDFLIIACDGLWDYVSEAMATAIVYRELDRDPCDLEVISQHLVHYARNQGSTDNISTIVVFLTDPRQIAARNQSSNSLLANVPLNIMESQNPFLTNANGQTNANLFGKQHTNGDSTEIDENHRYQKQYDAPNGNGKHANGAAYDEDDDDDEDDEDDLGPETDVDAVDEGPGITSNAMVIENLSRELFPEKSDDREKLEPESPTPDNAHPRTQPSEADQNALIPDADNVADSEDSEDEWNYYPNKETDNVDKTPAEEVEAGEIKENEVITNTESTNDETNERIETHSLDTCLGNSDIPEDIEKSELIESDIRAKDNLPEKLVIEGSEDMDFQLNPNAAEFVPVSSPITHIAVSSLNDDFPVAGSPQKQTVEVDDIQVPSQGEFQDEIGHRPHETTYANGGSNKDISHTDFTDYLMDRQKGVAGVGLGLDESEVSSTRAEFGDDSTFSFVTASEFHRTGISTIDDSLLGSEREYDIAKDPMAMSFTPGDFEAAFEQPGCDLNAVHQLSDVDLLGADETTLADAEGLTAQSPDLHPELATLVTPDTDHPPPTPAFPHSQTDMQGLLDEFDQKEAARERGNESPEPLVPNDSSLISGMVEIVAPMSNEESRNYRNAANELDDLDVRNASSPVNADPFVSVDATAPTFCSVSDKFEQSPATRDIDEPFVEEIPVDCQKIEREISQTSSLAPNFDNLSHGEAEVLGSSPVPPASAEDLVLREEEQIAPKDDAPDSSKPTEIISFLADDSPILEISPSNENVNASPLETSPEEKSDAGIDILGKETATDRTEIDADSFLAGDKEPETTPRSFETVKFEQISHDTSSDLGITSPKSVEDSQRDFVLNFSASPSQVEEIPQKESVAQASVVSSESVLAEPSEPAPKREEIPYQELSNQESIVDKPLLNLSESMQEFTGLEQQLINPEAVVAPLSNGITTNEPEIEPESRTISEKPVVAAVAAVTAAAAAVGAAATATSKTTKSKPLVPKTTKTSITAKTTLKSTATSPTKTSTATSRTTTAAPIKKPTSSAPTRPSTLKAAAPTATKSPVPKTAPTAKQPLSTKVASPRTTSLASRPKPSSISPSKLTPTSTTEKKTEKKPTSNDDAKPLGRPAAPKPPARTSSATAASKPLVRTATSRPASATTTNSTSAAKPRSSLTSVTAKPKSSTTTTVPAPRPKTAPATTTATKPRTSLASKSQITDKQTKDTANKQLSSARSTSTTVNRSTTRTSVTGTTSTLRKNIANKTSTTTSAPVPAKKPAPITRPGGKLSSLGKTTTTTTTTSTKSVTSNGAEVTENGVCEIRKETVTMVSNVDEDVPKKDASPVIVETDNQLIVTAD